MEILCPSQICVAKICVCTHKKIYGFLIVYFRVLLEMGLEMSKRQGKHQTISKCETKTLKFLLKNTAFSRATIAGWHEVFVQGCPTGRLDPAAFVNMFDQLLPGGGAEQFSTNAFRVMDQDGSGWVDFRELVVALHLCSAGSTEQRLRWAFAMYDEDGDGRLSLEEVRGVVGRVYRMLGSDGRGGEDGAAWAEELFASMDGDGDGQVTEEEFVAACGRHRDLATVLAPGVARARARPVGGL